MGKCLVIGSTVCDVMIYLDALPGRQGDAHIKKQVMSLGGCAFNVVNILHHLGVEYDFISPVGTGIYGTFVKDNLYKLGIQTPISLDGANGCCYCFVESDGERTFLSDHGVEYSFDPSWLDGYDLSQYDYVYVCGLEVEEDTGQALVDWLKTCGRPVIFAPGPRGNLIPEKRMAELLELSPILHLNEQETLSLSQETDIKTAIRVLYGKTKQLLIVTRGSDGAVAFDGVWNEAPSVPTEIVDTVGAGDSHVGAMMAALATEKSIIDSLAFANRVASQVVATQGVHLPSHMYEELRSQLNSL
ncbi:carbohydrate kinase family protein [Streptococcus suis]|uniref:PfkB family carbohydrate kinase n=1 Tax=Streptococcus suis TaxID=1307 RepID=A0A0Z8LMD5_STRSU|nr:PfkB family carbohydrate kinase [Streptococcus suis]MBY5024940.1 carbohydrate kinase family protein [Streptococcus suis]MDG4526087.1 PfkB family carbohydrate kinase [Streptococcus suis]MDG4528473.1 PfkB family carbohydrate kinase [Streptococcus suis]MDW8765123.1 PfkB family carbohydrate kinase [Streptococcus suis]NQG28200.1 carbohydrate kinase family protein [Streptococcus suis]